MKANPVRVSKQPQSEDAPALQGSLAAASVRDSNLSGLMSSASSSVSRPSLATVKLSQGVSQGLLIKRVQPKYPTSALAVHKEGAVQIEATINKEGNVNNLKVLDVYKRQLHALAGEKTGETISTKLLDDAIRDLGIDPEKRNPAIS